MKQKEKQLLLIDLCARLSYGVLFMVPDINEPVELLSINPKRDKPLEIDDGHDENSSTYWNLEDVTPYLRPMSSMTEKEQKEYDVFCCEPYLGIDETTASNFINWLNSHHFDYRGLIEKGLALEAPEGMYNN